MLFTKKLFFVPFFLLAFALLTSGLNQLLSSYDLLFTVSIGTLIQLIKIAALFFASALLFAVFAAIANNSKFILPIIAITALMPLFFFPLNLALIFAFLCALSLYLSSLALGNSLKNYLTFNASSLIGPVMRTTQGFLILSFCIIYFLSLNKTLSQSSFQVPDALIDEALKMMPIETEQQTANIQNLPKIDKEQIEMLKKNPQLLEQYGLDPKIINTLSPNEGASIPDLGENMIKQTVKEQIQNIIKPYQSFIPPALTLLLFLTLQSLTTLFNFLIHPILWIIFLILEKTGYIKFEIEQRPVKKLII